MPTELQVVKISELTEANAAAETDYILSVQNGITKKMKVEKLPKNTGPKGEPGSPGANGADGKSLEYIWRGTELGIRQQGQLDYVYVNLQGEKGEQGLPGTGGSGGTATEIELQKGTTYIQWRYVGESSWRNLIAIADITGPQGIQGVQGERGNDGTFDKTTQFPELTTRAKDIPGAIIENTAQIADITQQFNSHVANHPSGEGSTEQQIDDRINIKLSTQYKANPVEPLNIKTSYIQGEDQPTHPKALYFPSGWNGHKYWMCYTPYPGNANMHENPCITYSDDGVNWSEIGITNPIQPKPSSGYNSDCHLVFVNNTLECWWREVTGTDVEIIKRKKSSNGTTWGSEETLYTTSTTTADCCLSPSVIYDEGKYKIWFVYRRECLKCYESTDGTNWQYVRNINVDTSDGVYKVWHFDIIKNKNIYEFVGCYQYNGLFDKNNFIYYSKSDDNVTYSTPIKILGNGDLGQFDDLELYRPSLLIDGNGNYRMYYGAQKNKAIWHIGLVTCRDIESLNNLLVGQNAIIEKMQVQINELYSLIENGGGGIPSIPVELVTLNYTSYNLTIGQKLQLTETVLPKEATNKTVTWTSSDESKATVSNAGLVTSKGLGNVVITCKSNSDNSKSATCSITINENTILDSYNLYDFNDVVKGSYYNASNGEITANEQWNSSPKIQIQPNKEIAFGGNSCAFFDENDFISGLEYSDTFQRTGTTPNNAKYISFAIQTNSIYKSYLYELPIPPSATPINENLNIVANTIKTGYYDAYNGNFTESTQYYSSDFIKVDPGITINQTGGVTICCWNKSKKLFKVEFDGVLNNNSVVPMGVDYITVSVSSSSYANLVVKRTS